jgi:DNA-binding response OmpR family regulator
MHQILIIEDDSDIAESLQYNFRREGFMPVIAESGEKGLRLALNEKNPPGLIVLDLMLPGMSGMELCRRLRREPLTEKTPIIMLTAKAA